MTLYFYDNIQSTDVFIIKYIYNIYLKIFLKI